MLTEKPAAKPLAKTGVRPDGDVVCWFEGKWVPLADAKVGIMTHGFLYGTAVFEGIRAYWNEEQGQLYVLQARAHYERMTESSRVMLMDLGRSVDELIELTVELLRRNAYREDAYVRPTLYKSTEAIGVRLHNLDCQLNVFAVPFGEYIAIDRGIDGADGLLAPQQRPFDPVSLQDRRCVREQCLLQERGPAQRLRRSDRVDA